MLLKLDSNYKTLYMKLYGAIKDKIIDGSLEPNSKLPSIRNLMSEYNISKNTVIEAYCQLETEGYIRSEEKKGFFVNEIENLVMPTKPSFFYENNDKNHYLYDFSADGVDSTLFPYSTWKNIFSQVMMSYDSEILATTDTRGDFDLRLEIAKYLNSSRGLDISPHDLIISAGTEHLFNFIKKIFPEDTTYAFENPGYPWGNPFFYRDLKNVIPIDLDAEGINIDTVKEKKADLVLVTPAHQFPTGITMSINRRIQLLNRALKTNTYIIEDDYDGEFKYKGQPVAPLKSMDVSDRVIYMGTFSKSLSPGLRVSYMAMPKSLIKKFDHYFSGYSCSCPTFVQKALAQFMKEGYFVKHINKMRTVYRKKYELCEKRLSEIPNVNLKTSDSGNSFIISINKLKDVDLFIKECQEKSIYIASINAYGYNNSNKKDFIFGFAKLDMDTLEKGIDLLSIVIQNNLI